jgi:hypothetical protein
MWQTTHEVVVSVLRVQSYDICLRLPNVLAKNFTICAIAEYFLNLHNIRILVLTRWYSLE